jgi:ADP-ribosylglycohydrolase
MGIPTSEGVSAALFIVLQHRNNQELAIIRAVGLGGDADMIAAMTGAFVGALHGSNWFPKRWYNALENGLYGRDKLITIAKKLARIGKEGR